jgi:hypothetical protein
MGCDIHAYIDYDHLGSISNLYGRLYLGRDYTLFGLIAGVRGQCHPVVAPRSLPSVTSFSVRYEAYSRLEELKPDYHSHTWLTTDEVASVAKEYKKLVPESERGLILLQWQGIHLLMKHLARNSCTPRFVCWFDS